MCNRNSIIPPPIARYEALRLPDGTHSGARIDRARFILEIQRKGVKYYFDLAIVAPIAEQIEYDRDCIA